MGSAIGIEEQYRRLKLIPNSKLPSLKRFKESYEKQGLYHLICPSCKEDYLLGYIGNCVRRNKFPNCPKCANNSSGSNADSVVARVKENKWLRLKNFYYNSREDFGGIECRRCGTEVSSLSSLDKPHNCTGCRDVEIKEYIESSGFKVKKREFLFINHKHPIEGVYCKKCSNPVKVYTGGYRSNFAINCDRCNPPKTVGYWNRYWKDIVRGHGCYVTKAFKKEGRFIYGCKCINGHELKINLGNLSTRGYIACPLCSGSALEKKGVELILSLVGSKATNQESQKTFEGCRTPNNGLARFDYYFELGKRKIVVEVNGEQHYKPAFHSFSGENPKLAFEYQQKVDKLKAKFCKKHKITLIIVPYWIFKSKKEVLNFTSEIKELL